MIAEWRPKGADYAAALAAAAPQRVGVVTSVIGLGLEVSGLDCALGDLVTVGENPGLDAEVVAALDGSVRCMPLAGWRAWLLVTRFAPKAARYWFPPGGACLAGSWTVWDARSTARVRCSAGRACRSTTRHRTP